jgi:Zn-finger nucleic acid-binding protein
MTSAASLGSLAVACEAPVWTWERAARDSDMGTAALVCPRCEIPVLHEHLRDGVAIDVCQCCGGVWLDRGELELLLASAGSRRALARRPRRSTVRDSGVRRCGRTAWGLRPASLL